MALRNPDGRLADIDWRWVARLTFISVIVMSVGISATGYVKTQQRVTTSEYEQQAQVGPSGREQLVGARENVTVVSGLESNLRNTKALYAFAPDGRLLYYANQSSFADVDPSPHGARTVLAVRHDLRGETDCPRPCTNQYLTRINLTTGARERVYQWNTPHHRATNAHDADRIAGTDSYLIASIWRDAVWQINTSTGVVEWGWQAQDEYPRRSGGPYWWDWVHLNDVEQTPQGVMISLRNQDSVVFVDRETGLREDWTLGGDDKWDILFEQHQPDYIPAKRGGPAILVADSENNRVVEYQRVNGSWEQSWVYQDDRMDWPRDADRLPNGHTLIADSHANRVIEVNRRGKVVWSATISNPYEAERLGTGDESAGGPSAVRANLTSVGGEFVHERGSHIPGANEGGWTKLQKYWHGIKFVLPIWVTQRVFAALVLGLVVALCWAGAELYWRGVRIRVPVVRR